MMSASNAQWDFVTGHVDGGGALRNCAICGEPATRGYPTMGGGFTHLCNACPVSWEPEDQTAEGDTSEDFGGFLRTAM